MSEQNDKCILARGRGKINSYYLKFEKRKRSNKPTVFKLFPTFILHPRKKKELLKMRITSSSLL